MKCLAFHSSEMVVYMLGVLVGFMELRGIVLNWSCVQREAYVQDMVSGGLVVSVTEVRLVIPEGLEM